MPDTDNTATQPPAPERASLATVWSKDNGAREPLTVTEVHALTQLALKVAVAIQAAQEAMKDSTRDIRAGLFETIARQFEALIDDDMVAPKGSGA